MRRARGELERAVLAVVRASNEPVAVADVVAGLDPAPAYTTVMTTLARLHGRGVLDRETRGRSYAYRPTATPDAAGSIAAAHRMQRLLRAQGTRVDVLSRFVAELEPEDGRVLRALLAEPQQHDPAGAGQPPAGDER